MEYTNTKKYEVATPYPLRNKKQWVLQKLEWNEKNGKFNKIPINAVTGGNAQPDNPITWTDFNTACQAVDKFNADGIAFVLTPNDNIVGIDLDLDPITGKLTANGEKVLSLLKDKTYIEHSVSGAIHCFGYAKKDGTYCKGKDDKSIEMYGSNGGNRCIMITGKLYKDKFVRMADIQKEVSEIYKDYLMRPEVDRQQNDFQTQLNAKEVYDKMMKSKSADAISALMRGDISGQNSDYSRADLALCAYIAFYTDNSAIIDEIYRQSGLYSAPSDSYRKGGTRADKWHSRRLNGTYGSQTIELAMKHAFKHYEPAKAKPKIKT